MRVIASADGRAVWVTARGSNERLKFSTRQLLRHPAHALVAEVRVGESPVGLASVNHGRQIAVADSKRFNTDGVDGDLAIVNTADARPTVLGHIPTGGFPRDITVSPAGTLLVSDFASQELSTLNIQALAAFSQPKTEADSRERPTRPTLLRRQ